MAERKVAKIRELNDAFRAAPWESLDKNRVILTRGIAALGQEKIDEIMSRVIGFSDFNPDNDPWGAHDFGAFKVEGVPDKVYWKIDYYDLEMQGGSEDRSDPTQTTRVLTVLLSSEY